MDDIAESAGVTKPLVYQHFESKRALYLELMDVVSRELVTRIVKATATAFGPRQQVELGFAAYFELMVDNEPAFRLLYGRDAPDDFELGAALRRVEETIAQAIDPLIDAGLDPGHRLLLAHAVVGMAEGASRHWLDTNRTAERLPRRGGRPAAGRLRRRAPGRCGPAGHPPGRFRLGRAPPGPPDLRHPGATGGAPPPAPAQAVTSPSTTGCLVLWTTPPACSAVMANASTGSFPATLKGTTLGAEPSRPSEMVRLPITPQSW